MKHSDKDIEAAKEILVKHLKAGLNNENWNGEICKLNGERVYLPEIEAMLEFTEHKQKGVDELVEFVLSIKKYLPGPEFNKAQKLIQKQKR
jgi:hypothetical protein